MNPLYNPFIEFQAIDRGQQREVRVTRLIPGEGRVLELQEKKRELISGALDDSVDITASLSLVPDGMYPKPSSIISMSVAET
jgi:SNF2 family DNA or RNA helicase